MAIHELFAYVCVHDTAKALAFYAQAFGAKEKLRLTEPGGRIGHAELDFGGTTLMLSDEFPEMGVRSPRGEATRSFTLHLHVDDADATLARAVQAGAEWVRKPEDHFYGERSGTVRDPFGVHWLVGHALEQVTPEEMQRRYTALFSAT